MTAGVYDLTVEKGSTFSKTIYLKDSNRDPVSLIGYTARLQMRRSIHSSSYFAELTTENGGIAITGSLGKIVLSMSDTDTSALTVDRGTYDLELVNDTGVTKLLRGSISILEETTR
jgi:hypothetical protein